MRSCKTDIDLRIGFVQISYVRDVSFNICYVRLYSTHTDTYIHGMCKHMACICFYENIL